jgi:hypothetical protein
MDPRVRAGLVEMFVLSAAAVVTLLLFLGAAAMGGCVVVRSPGRR